MSPIDMSPKDAAEKAGQVLGGGSAVKEFKRESTTARLLGAGPSLSESHTAPP